MIEDTLSELKGSISKAHEALKRELAKLRTGRANPALLDSVRVEYYGSPTPLNQMASVNIPEPRLITVKPFEKAQLRAIEKAIIDANLGLNPQNDGEIIRLPMPPLTEDRRKDLVKVAKKHGEECKVAIRHARHEAKDMLSAYKEEGDISEDDFKLGEKKLEETVQEGTGQVDQIVAKKEKDILEL